MLAAEYLLRDEQEGVGVKTLRHWLIDEGLWQARRQGRGIDNGVSVAPLGRTGANGRFGARLVRGATTAHLADGHD